MGPRMVAMRTISHHSDRSIGNFTCMATLRPNLRALSAQWNLPIHVFAWNSEMKRKGLERDALYLLRPDGYIAVATNQNRSEAVGAYLAEMGFSLLQKKDK